jgi:cytochrome c oxidase assembly protein subunit 15
LNILITTPHQPDSPWPHTVALLLVCATFPLIFIGGLVTTTGAGMAFPTWLTIDGHFFLFYPLHRWLGGGWDQLVEHGHRLWASLVGVITIALLLLLWLYDSRRWVWCLGTAALGLVCFQGLLGGLRVIQNETAYAMVHGCVGPLFFGLCIAIAVCTSRVWKRAKLTDETPAGAKFQRLALITAGLAYVQLIVGAWLRHRPSYVGSESYGIAVLFHLLLAAALLLHILLLALRAWRLGTQRRALAAPSAMLLVLLVAQLTLGGATWVVKFGWPEWFANYDFAQRYVVRQGGWPQTLITTGHVAVGSLIFGVALMIALRSFRLLRRRAQVLPQGSSAHVGGGLAVEAAP